VKNLDLQGMSTDELCALYKRVCEALTHKIEPSAHAPSNSNRPRPLAGRQSDNLPPPAQVVGTISASAAGPVSWGVLRHRQAGASPEPPKGLLAEPLGRPDLD
jgi:hypothetical protein